MSYLERFVNAIVRALFRLVYVMDIDELQTLPPHGPGIILTNHTSNLEGPAYYVFMQPRPTTALGKIELWANTATRFFMRLWGIIPVSRGKVDTRAMRRCVRALDRGQFLGMAPEGTRSASETLQRAHPGVALLATMRRVPVYPIVHWGFRGAGACMRRLRRSRVVFRAGTPFYVQTADNDPNGRPSASQLRAIADEMMYQIALLLPERMRGYYSDLSRATTDHLEFIDR